MKEQVHFDGRVVPQVSISYDKLVLYVISSCL